MKLLIVYNICGISGRDNTSFYTKSLYSIIKQNFDSFKVCLSSCLNSAFCINNIRNLFKDKISYSIVNKTLPISVTFNLAVENCIKHYGEFDGYVYIDSGCLLQDENIISKLYKIYQEESAGICAAFPDTDFGGKQWWDKGKYYGDESQTHTIFGDSDRIRVPLGKTTNLHCQIFSSKWYHSYGRILPDIFAGHCMESIFPYMCSAIYQPFIITDIPVQHIPNLDGGSSGFSPDRWEIETGRPRYDHPFVVNSIISRIVENEYFGGYEECFHIIDHDPSKFDENGYTKDDSLLKKIKSCFFLNKEEFDYSTIGGSFAP